MNDKSIRKPGSSAEIEAFVSKVKEMSSDPSTEHTGRLIFAMDATASRQPSWDLACHLQRNMFETVVAKGKLAVQLCFYRGYNECKTSRWMQEAVSLHKAMAKVACMGGQTQIARVLKHTLREADASAVDALVFVGDCMEENIDELCQLAGKLGIKGVPVFLFQEGGDPVASNAFREMARLSGGAHCSFDQQSAQQLTELLKAVALFATGGRQAALEYSQKTPFLEHLASQLESK